MSPRRHRPDRRRGQLLVSEICFDAIERSAATLGLDELDVLEGMIADELDENLCSLSHTDEVAIGARSWRPVARRPRRR